MKWFLKRLAEPSSGAALSAVASAVASALYAGVPWSVAVPTILAGVAGVLLPERGNHG